MNSQKLREKFIKFFERRGHKLLPPASLIQEGDPSVLFTTAGVQQFKIFYQYPNKAPAKRVITIQPCFRTSDIEEVGDGKHLTFFEMLGNFSFGDYFKEEAINMAWQFLIHEVGLPFDKLSITVFGGDKKERLPKDEESEKIWRKIVPKEKIRFLGKEDNFWGPVGETGPCGPCTEILFNGLEIWNIVFNQYYREKSGNLKELKNKGVDTGMGLERLSAVILGKNDVYETDLYRGIIDKIKSYLTVYQKNVTRLKDVRIIADHLRGAVFLIASGLDPSNKLHGYVLRRIIRRILGKFYLLGIDWGGIGDVIKKVIEPLKNVYPFLLENQNRVSEVIEAEEKNFGTILKQGLKELEKIINKKKVFTGREAFYLYDTYGLPFEITKDVLLKRGIKINKQDFEAEMEKQQIRSKSGQKLLQARPPNPRLHTAVHLLHQALRKVLGNHVKQAGQDISGEILRFDFTHPKKLTQEEIKKVEVLVNQKIKENLKVKMEKMSVEEAEKSGAIALFKDRYGEEVSVYSIGNFSKEVCAGPHVSSTGLLKSFKIISEKSSASGIRRIKARVG